MNRLILVLLACVVVIPIGVKSHQSAQNSASTAFSVQSSGHTIVRVSGDVRHPGVYHVPANTLTIDAILLAGTERRPQSFIPKGAEALVPVNGADIRLEMHPDGSASICVGMIPASQRLLLRIPLDPNVMSTTDFECLPGVGPVLAQRISEYRHNNGGKLAPEELKSICGIGEKKYNQLKQFFK